MTDTQNKQIGIRMNKTIPFTMFLIAMVLLTISYNGFSQKTIFKIAFGSCGSEDHPLPIFNVVVKHDITQWWSMILRSRSAVPSDDYFNLLK